MQVSKPFRAPVSASLSIFVNSVPVPRISISMVGCTRLISLIEVCSHKLLTPSFSHIRIWIQVAHRYSVHQIASICKEAPIHQMLSYHGKNSQDSKPAGFHTRLCVGHSDQAILIPPYNMWDMVFWPRICILDRIGFWIGDTPIEFTQLALNCPYLCAVKCSFSRGDLISLHFDRMITYASANASQSSAALTIPSELAPLGSASPNFVILPPSAVPNGIELAVLIPGVTYTATLYGTAPDTGSVGAASVQFVLNQPPQSGTCQACRYHI